MIKINNMAAIIKNKPFDDLMTFLRGIKNDIAEGSIVLSIDDTDKAAMLSNGSFKRENTRVSITFELRQNKN